MPVMDFPSSPINGQTTTDGRYYFDSSVGSTGAWRSTPLPVGGLPAGSIMAWGTNTPPANWLLADGSAVSRSVYSSLFAVIGTQYGAGDGTTTFNLPDLRGRVPVGRNGGTFGTLGATGGAETVALSIAEMPAHNHGGATSTTGAHTHLSPNGNSLITDLGTGAQLNSASGSSYGFRAAGSSTQSAGDHSHTISSQGSGTAHNNLQPYQVVNYIIKFSAGWTAGDSELATRLGVVETANATTNRSGFVPIIPTSVSVASGSASVNASGVITLSSANDIRLQGVFSSAYRNYRIIANLGTSGAPPNPHQMRFIQSTGNPDASAGYSYTNFYQQAGSTGNGVSSSTNQTVGSYGFAQMFTIEVFSPNESSYTMTQFNGVYGHTWFLGQCGFNGSTPFTGFNLLNNTLGGTIQVYGYR